MLQRLSGGPESVTELATTAPMTLAAVVQHLQVLEAGGLIESRKIGRVRTCRLNPDGLSAAEYWITGRQKSLRRHSRGEWT